MKTKIIMQKTIKKGEGYEVVAHYTNNEFGLEVISIDYVCSVTNCVVPIDNFLYDFLSVGTINDMEDKLTED